MQPAPDMPLLRQGIKDISDIPAQSMERLQKYVDLLKEWNQKINLVGKSTMPDVWNRHIMDSLQLLKYIPQNARTVTDFGSGAGLPGLILAIMEVAEIHLIESDGRKARFLHEAAKITGAKVHIHNERAENLKPWQSDIITARACAPFERLLPLIYPFMGKNSICIFQKGQSAREELKKAEKNWGMEADFSPSIISAEKPGWIVTLTNVRPKK